MHSTKSFSASPAGSIATLTSLRHGYAPLSTCRTYKDGNKEDSTNGLTFKQASLQPRAKSCITTFFCFLYRYIVTFLRFLCFRLPHTVDNESLLTVEYKNDSKGEDQECCVLLEHEPLSSIQSNVPLKHHSFTDVTFQNCKPKREESAISNKPKSSTIAVDQIKASQAKGEAIASNGKDQMNATKVAVWKSKRQLKEVRDDVSNIRDNIETAKKLFSEVEKGIRDYRWETISRDIWTSIDYRGELYCLSLSSSVTHMRPFQQMYRDHRIFVEEMKFHFKWNHGILL